MKKITMKNVNMQNNLQHMYACINCIIYKDQSEKFIKFILHNITLKLGICLTLKYPQHKKLYYFIIYKNITFKKPIKIYENYISLMKIKSYIACITGINSIFYNLWLEILLVSTTDFVKHSLV